MRGKTEAQISENPMTVTHTRTLTITCKAVSLGEQEDSAALAELRRDCLRRIQGSAGTLIEQGIYSGSLTYQDRNPPVNLHWSLSVSDCLPDGAQHEGGSG
jgi:hypothetical protein